MVDDQPTQIVPIEQIDPPVLNPHSSLVVEAIEAFHHDVMHELRQLGEARGEQPGSFNIWPQPLLTSQRIRAEKLVISSLDAAGISIGLQIGESTERRVRQMEGTQEYDLLRVVQSGQRIGLIDLATGGPLTDAQILDAWVVGFTE